MILKFALVLVVLLVIKLDASQVPGPVPLPQVYKTTEKQFSLDVENFKFKFLKSSYICDVTKLAFTRYHKIIFTPESYNIVQDSARSIRKLGKFSLNRNQNVTDLTPINHLSVHILNPCEKYPTLESDESCNFYTLTFY